jgi:hypothetical protein
MQSNPVRYYSLQRMYVGKCPTDTEAPAGWTLHDSLSNKFPNPSTTPSEHITRKQLKRPTK